MTRSKNVAMGTLMLAVLIGSSITSVTPANAATESPVKVSSASISAKRALDGLRVKGRAPKTGYTRERFGQAWADVNRNGCDTRIICTSEREMA